MRLFFFVFCSGGAVFYFINHAFKVDSFADETLINNVYHFVAGFIFLAGAIRLNLKHKFKFFILLVIMILLLDEIFDYMRYVKDFSFLSLFYNLYLLLWGALSGLVLSKRLKNTNIPFV